MSKMLDSTELDVFEIWGEDCYITRIKIGGKIQYLYHFQIRSYRGRNDTDYYIKAKSIDEAKKLLKSEKE